MSEARALSHWLYVDHTDESIARSKYAAERALALQPELPEAHRAMGNFYYWGRRDYDNALRELAVAQRSQPNNSDLVNSVGFVERRQGRMEEAIKHFREVTELDPGSSNAWFSWGETLLLVRRYAEAIPVLRRGIDIAPDQPDCYSVLVRVMVNQSGDIANARGVVRQALTRLSPARFAGNFMPAAYVIAGDETLRREFEALGPTDFGSDTAAAFVLRAELRRLSGDPAPARALNDSARVVLERQVRRLPDDYGFHARLGLAYARLGRAEEAIGEGKKAIELLPPSRDAYFGMNNVINLAQIYAALDQPQNAVEQLRAALAVPSRISTETLRVDPEWDPIRADPGFRTLVKP